MARIRSHNISNDKNLNSFHSIKLFFIQPISTAYHITVQPLYIRPLAAIPIVPKRITIILSASISFQIVNWSDYALGLQKYTN